MDKLQFTIKALEERAGYAKLSIEPLSQGFGHTIGNSLRRTLLNSIKGAAISQVMIDGVKHKFTTLEGMKEDIVEFCLQSKKIRVKYEGDEPIEMTLSAQGPGEVKASDIECPAGVEIMNKDLVLANLADKKNTLKATFTVESGYGYQFAEERKSSTLGVIPLDTSFSPILRVRYTVKATRVGRHTDFDNVIMEIWTDETIEPTQALVQSAKILMRYFDQLVNPVIPEVEEEKATDTQEQEVYKLTVEELDLPTRIANALRKGGYKTVKDLSLASRDDISKVKNLGGKSVGTVIEKLEEKGVTLKG